MSDNQQHYEKMLAYVNNALELYFTKPQNNERLLEAMRYSLLAGGKRIRPILVLEFAFICGETFENALPFACAVEMLHTYSLIHDDLPCMDNDELRRGKPTNHVVFGEWLATVAGDALQSAAYETILSASCDAGKRAEAARILAVSTGENGMCAGQYLDMESENSICTLEDLEKVHSLKTAALIEASCLIGCVVGGAGENQLQAARHYAKAIGLAFQLVDDLLDTESSAEELGKPIGSDEKNGKITFVSLLGAERCREMISELTLEAKKALTDGFSGDIQFLEWFADMLAGRKY